MIVRVEGLALVPNSDMWHLEEPLLRYVGSVREQGFQDFRRVVLRRVHQRRNLNSREPLIRAWLHQLLQFLPLVNFGTEPIAPGSRCRG